jgi:hypothetical protein
MTDSTETTSRGGVSFNYEGRADLYPGRGKNRGKGLGYRRFDSAALAIQYAIEEMPASQAMGTVLEVDEQRFTMDDITALYQRQAYPLRRTARAKPEAASSEMHAA